jgi:alpha-galactosidase
MIARYASVPFDNITRENIMGSMYSCSLPLSESSLTGLGYERVANAITDFSLSSGTPPLILSMCQWGRVRLHLVAIFGL